MHGHPNVKLKSLILWPFRSLQLGFLNTSLQSHVGPILKYKITEYCKRNEIFKEVTALAYSSSLVLSLYDL